MQTIVDLIEESCRKFPDKAALRHKVNGVWQEIPYRTIRETSDRVTAGLIRHGFVAGDHAALLAPSSPQWVIAYLGILKAGGIAIPIDKELKSNELRHILTDCGARVLFTDRPCLDPVLEIIPDLSSLDRTVMLNPLPPGSGPTPFSPIPAVGDELARQGRLLTFDLLLSDAQHHPVPSGPDETAVVLYTSGTTGRSKGAMLSHANIVSNIRGATAHFTLDGTIHTLSFLPISHVFEQVCGILLPLSLGGTVSFCESVKKLGENLTEVKPTFFLGVPAVFRMIHDRIVKDIGARRLSRLLFSCSATRPLVTARISETFGSRTVFISGGAALDPAVAEGLERFGLTIYQGYGITETAPVIAAECPGRKRLGTVGRVLPDVEVKIDRPNEEMVGEVLVKGPNVMQGYYRDPRATAEVLADGWYRTGDLGRVDRDGFLTICGRVKNLIVTPNGKNVYPEEVENELLKCPYIAEVMVYGHEVAPATEEIRAIIYPDREALDGYGRKEGKCPMTIADVEALLRTEVSAACERLAAYKRVRKFSIREDEFPKTTTRKIKRFEMELRRHP